jgi:hypothetical protein
LPIINNAAALSNYPFRALSPEVVDLLERAAKEADSSRTGVALKLLECYCDLQGVEVTYLSLSTPRYLEVVRGLLGALGGTSLIGSMHATRRTLTRQICHIHEALCAEIPALARVGFDKLSMELNDSTWERQRANVIGERAQYWNGWSIESAKGISNLLNLPCLWLSHGKEFTEDFYQQWLLFFKKQARPAYSEVNKMAKFLSSHSEDWPAVTFQHPDMIKSFFLAFMKDFFLDAHHRRLNINSQIKAWKLLVGSCEEIFLETGKWATPYIGGLPKPVEKEAQGLSSRKRKGANGEIVHEKLITPVPLHVTDEEAIEILFHRIKTDISIVESWALEQTRALITKVRQRQALANTGTVITSGSYSKSIEEIGLDNICATFEQDGFVYTNDYLLARFGLGSFKKVADILGLPTAERLYPYQCLLVREHPEITTGFFDKLKLMDDNGDYVGYIKSDTGAKLIGYKDRRGGTLSEQIIDLSERSQQWVEEIIEITQPLRDTARIEGDPVWKELFITCGLGFSNPTSARPQLWNRSKFESTPTLLDTLKKQFSAYEHLMPNGVEDFLQRTSLSTLRASCGVEVYLRTKSVTKMAKALGHAQYDTNLLRRYLPEAILAFFQTRWIRIFQRSFICEAMKDSPYLLEAASFESMDELHTFLKNHALKDIPEHLRNPENKKLSESGEASNTHIYISIDVGIMTALLSLEVAVNTSKKENQICGAARYWSEVSKAVSDEIERGSDSLLKEHLNTAKKHCNPRFMDKVIYVSAA